MKGIILAGGSATRLHPSTISVCKQLLPIYDKPMIYYPLTTLMLAGIREILVITTPHDLELFKKLLSDGSQLGLKIEYKVQQTPRGLADAFILGESFIGGEKVCLILGDNVFYSQGLSRLLRDAAKLQQGAKIFGYYVKNPEDYGVVDFDSKGNVLSIEEKPKKPRSNYVVPGIYFYDNQVIAMAKNLKPSTRGELEITDINRGYLEKKQLSIDLFSRGTAWLDTGTHEALVQASNFIQTIEARQGLKIGCPEEISFINGWISLEKLEAHAETLSKTPYGHYLKSIAQEARKGKSV